MISEFIIKNLDLVLFINGLAFYVMGAAIIIQPRKEGSVFELTGFIWLLAAFGFPHGINEWMDFLSLAKGYNLKIWYITKIVFLTSSFIFLFEFGRKLISISVNKFLNVWSTVFFSVITIVFIFMSKQDQSIFPRYLLGLPGGLMSALGFFLFRTPLRMIKINLSGL